ncbi:MAG: hypothetical protein RLZZ156_400 [Deinococcota bacterium]|jgi:HEPN domain-containing protein
MPDSQNYTQWLEYANNDWQAATMILGKIPSTTAFLLHEAIEKYLKAVLLFEKKSIERLHNIVYLLHQVENPPAFDTLESKAARVLDLSFTVGRYPDQNIEITLENTQAVYQAALVLRTFARERLGLEQK